MPLSKQQAAAAYELPKAIRAYIEAANRFDLEGFMATFTDDAVVNDQQREYAGPDAIRVWAAREIMKDHVTMDVTSVVKRDANFAVTAVIDGTFDKTGLPDPLSLAFYFSLAQDRIAQLIILHNKSDVTTTAAGISA